MLLSCVFVILQAANVLGKNELQEAQASTETCSNITNGTSQSSTAGAGAEGAGPIKATEPMWRCSRIMHMQRDLNTTVLSSLEGIVDQMVWFRENWYEQFKI